MEKPLRPMDAWPKGREAAVAQPTCPRHLETTPMDSRPIDRDDIRLALWHMLYRLLQQAVGQFLFLKPLMTEQAIPGTPIAVRDPSGQ